MQQYYLNNWNRVVEYLGSDIRKGLLEYECSIRREEFGDNEIHLPYSMRGIEIIKVILKEKYIYGVIIAIVLFALEKLFILSGVTAGLLLLTVGSKIYLDIKKEKDREVIHNINSAKVVVIREGLERIVEAVELVKGDIVVLKKNSFVSADLRVIQSDNLKVDEKSVTGDDFLKDKYEEKLDAIVGSLGDIPNMIFRGSVVKEGTGVGIVVETGNRTELGKVINNIETSLHNKNTLNTKIQALIIKVILCMLLVQLIVFLIFPGFGREKYIVFLYGIFSILAICLPVITLQYKNTISRVLEDKGINLINFSTIDMSNNIKVMFLEKVGTLTQRKLSIEKIYTNENVYNKDEFDPRNINLKRIVDISLLCNNSIYSPEGNNSENDIHEEAYLNYGAEKAVFKSSLDNKNKRIFQVSVDGKSRLFTTVNKSAKGYRANTRGNIEEVLSACTHLLVNGIEKELTESEISKIKLADLLFSREGLVTEAFAYRSFSYQPSAGENIQSNLVFVGLIALTNPFIEGINEDIEELLDNGILPIIITEDNKILGEVIGRKLGLIGSSEEVLSGVEMSFMKSEELFKSISKARVFCRLTPEQKTFLVKIFKEDGFSVCVEGETLGDLARIVAADIGITKGKASSLVRRTSDLYSNISGIKAILYLRNYRETVWDGVRNGVIVYAYMVISQIMMMNFHYLFTEKHILSEYTLLLLNYLILTPIILLNMEYGKKPKNNKKVVITGVLYSMSPVISIIFLNNYYAFSYVVILGALSIIYTLINCKLSFRSFNRGIKLLILSLITYIISTGIVGWVYKVEEFETLGILMLSISNIFIIGEIIIIKWQE